MTDVDRIEQRLSAVERVVVDGDGPIAELSELSALAERVATIENRLAEQQRRIATLEGNLQSIEGYVGNVESINDDVERHAAAAIATADRLERRLDVLEVELEDLQGGILEQEVAAEQTSSSADSTPKSGRESTEDVPPQSVAAGSDSGNETGPTVGRGCDADAATSERERANPRSGTEPTFESKTTPEQSVATLLEPSTGPEVDERGNSATSISDRSSTDSGDGFPPEGEPDESGLLETIRSRLS